MAKFEVGNRVQMPGVPVVVEVLPASGEDDWAHASEFELAR